MAQEYIDQADQIDFASLKEAEDEYQLNLGKIGDIAKLGGAGYAGSALGYQALKYSPVGPAVGKQAKKVSTIVKDFYTPGSDKKKLMFDHLLHNERDEISKIMKSHWPQLKSLSPRAAEGVIRDEMSKYGEKTFAEFRARLDVEKFERMRRMKGAEIGGYKYTTLKRAHRHEKLAQEMIDWTENGKVNVERLRRNGLSKPVLTDVKNAFGSGNALDDHSRVMKAWGSSLSPSSKISVSKILDVGGDRMAITGSATRDAQYQMAEFVTRFAKLDDLKDVEKHARQRIYSMQTQKGLPTAKWNKLHKNITDIDNEVATFMKNYRYNKKTGIVNIMFSPQYKPHYLVGGVNASVNMRRTRYGNVTRNILVSDKYDVLLQNDPFQRKVHFNVTTTRDMKRVPRSIKFKTALKAKSWKDAIKHAVKFVSKRVINIALFKRL